MCNTQTVRPIHWTLVDQIIVSASNFLVLVLVARELGLADFGYIGLAYLTILFFNAQYRAIITQPLNVIYATKPEIDRNLYTSSVFWLNGLWFVFALIFVFLIGNFFFPDVSLLRGVLIFLVFSQLQEFVRRYWYSNNEIHKVVLNDLICYLGRLFIIGVYCWYDALTLENVFIIFSATSIISFAYAFRQGFTLYLVRLELMKHTLVEHWAFGKWLLLAAVSIMGATQLYPFILSVHGAEVVGAFIAIRHVLNSVSFGVQAVNSYLPSQLSRLFVQQDYKTVKQTINRLVIVLLVIGALFFLLMTIYAKEILMLFYKIDDESLMLPFVILLVGSFFTLLTSVPNAYLLAREKSREIFKFHLITVIFSLTLGVILSLLFGLLGASVCVTLVLAYLFFQQFSLVRRDLKREYR